MAPRIHPRRLAAMLALGILVRGVEARAGACCSDIGGACTEVVDAASCTGLIFDADASCTPHACEVGACCHNPSPCSDDVLGMHCAADAEFDPNQYCFNVCYRYACCLPWGRCEDLQNYDCFWGLGLLQAPDTCAAATCPPSVACCTGSDCIEMPAEACEMQGWRPADVPCSEARCDSVEACCNAGGCQDWLQIVCLRTGGEPLGPGSTCATLPCVTGCCRPDGSCVDMLPADCAAAGGFAATGTCVTATCERQACCLRDGTCAEVSVAECASLTGTPAGTASTCAGVTCEPSAPCCLPDGTCRDVDLGTCLGDGGAPGDAGRACSGWSCSEALPGRVPAGIPEAPGTPLTLARVGADLVLTWSPSCSPAATDYSVHEGSVGAWYSHSSLACSTGGLTRAAVTPGAGARYYLVAPLTDRAVGSFGTDSFGRERPRAAPVPCLPVHRTGCP